MAETSIPLPNIEQILGVKITAAALPEIGERRIRIAFASGAKITIVMSDEGKWQNAASFSAADGSPLTENIAVLHGSAEIAVPGDDGIPQIQHYEMGQVAVIDAGRTHATHPATNSVVVGLMSSNWQGAKRTADPLFDAAVQKLVAE